MLEEAGYSRDKVKLVLNRADRRAEVSTADVEAALGYPIYAEIPDDRAIDRSISLGVPLSIFAYPVPIGGALMMAHTAALFVGRLMGREPEAPRAGIGA